jgi:membrane protein DedA with SNARE-associated domain
MHDLLVTYGYWALFAVITLESTGLPLPGESALIGAALYAGHTHRFELSLLILAAAAGAILGDNIGYWIGRELGFRLLLRFGHLVGLDERRLRLGQYLFLRHGGKIVFLGRFVALLRTFAALLAGVNRMDWRRFLLCNASGGILWSTLYSAGGFYLGETMREVSAPIRWTGLGLAVVAVVAGAVFFRRNAARLEAEAVRALPGPLVPARRSQGRQ